jgi:hypothetical protein
MQKWEYLAFARVGGAWTDDKYDGRSPQEKLSDNGKEGWELVSVCYDSSGYNYYFKRPVVAKKKAAAKKAKPKAKSKSTKNK